MILKPTYTRMCVHDVVVLIYGPVEKRVLSYKVVLNFVLNFVSRIWTQIFKFPLVAA